MQYLIMIVMVLFCYYETLQIYAMLKEKHDKDVEWKEALKKCSH